METERQRSLLDAEAQLSDMTFTLIRRGEVETCGRPRLALYHWPEDLYRTLYPKALSVATDFSFQLLEGFFLVVNDHVMFVLGGGGYGGLEGGGGWRVGGVV